MASRSKKKRPAPAPARWPMTLARSLLAVAAAGAGYLAWISLTGGPAAGCGPESACSRVLQSRWAYWAGIPISLPALLVYLGLIAATCLTDETRPAAQRRRAWLCVLPLSILVAGAASWFISLQFVVLKSVCPFCMTVHCCGLSAVALLLWRAPISQPQTKPGPSEASPAIPPRRAIQLCLLGIIGLFILLGGQVWLEKPRHQVTSLAADAQVQPQSSTNRALQIHDGKFQLRVRDLPIIGAPEATHLMVSLFDYTCHHCRGLHGLLLAAQRQFSNQLAIISLPMPLEGNCNHLVKRTPRAHVNACQYARLGLAVWRADRKAFPRFDQWMFETPSPRPVEETKRYAAQLVGQEKLDQALADEWVNRQIQMDVAIYETNSRKITNGLMPQLVIGSAISVGPIDKMEDLNRLLRENLGLKTAP
ncbi:MAG: thioredoxin domain-containing protein [Chloroflexi bacterium]|nr:thioredoxin domain-containing protein [Chloroflexota bacterium]